MIDPSAAQPRRLAYFPRRFSFALLLFSAVVVVYILRVNMSVAAEKMMVVLGWSNEQKNLVLSSFYWGYTLGQLPVVLLVQMYGAKWIFGLSVAIPSLLTLLVPVACSYATSSPTFSSQNDDNKYDEATADPSVFETIFPALLIRVAIGLFESASFPCVYHYIPIWIAPREKTLMIPIIFSAMYFGEILGFSLSGIFVESSVHTVTLPYNLLPHVQLTYGGWPSVFYVFGGLGLLWFPFWAIFAYETPHSHPGISAEELALFNISTIYAVPKVTCREIEMNTTNRTYAQLKNAEKGQIISNTSANATAEGGAERGGTVAMGFVANKWPRRQYIGPSLYPPRCHEYMSVASAESTHGESGIVDQYERLETPSKTTATTIVGQKERAREVGFKRERETERNVESSGRKETWTQIDQKSMKLDTGYCVNAEKQMNTKIGIGKDMKSSQNRETREGMNDLYIDEVTSKVDGGTAVEQETGPNGTAYLSNKNEQIRDFRTDYRRDCARGNDGRNCEVRRVSTASSREIGGGVGVGCAAVVEGFGDTEIRDTAEIGVTAESEDEISPRETSHLRDAQSTKRSSVAASRSGTSYLGRECVQASTPPAQTLISASSTSSTSAASSTSSRGSIPLTLTDRQRQEEDRFEPLKERQIEDKDCEEDEIRGLRLRDRGGGGGGVEGREVLDGFELVRRTPWRQFLTHPIGFTLLVAGTVNGWINFFLLSEMPSFFTEVLGFDLRSAGVLCLFPYLALFCSVLLFGAGFDYLQRVGKPTCFAYKNNYSNNNNNNNNNINNSSSIRRRGREEEENGPWSVQAVRWCAQLVGFGGASVSLIASGFMPEKYSALAVMILALTLYGAAQSGVACAYSDVTTIFSSPLNSLCNTLGAFAGIMGPIAVSFFTSLFTEKDAVWGWRATFFLTGGLSLFSLVLWLLFMKAEVIPALNTPLPRCNSNSRALDSARQ